MSDKPPYRPVANRRLAWWRRVVLRQKPAPRTWAQQGGAVYDGKPGPAWEWAAEERRRR